MSTSTLDTRDADRALRDVLHAVWGFSDFRPLQREAMDLVYRHGGSTSFKRESRLAECWRDLHVVGQTVTIAPEWYPIGGRVYLGMDPGPRLR